MPEMRMAEYAERYGLTPAPSSLCGQVMRSKLAAIYAEESLHRLLPRHNVAQFEWDAAIGDSEARELFDLGNLEYSVVDRLIRQLLSEIAASLPYDWELVTENNARRMAFSHFQLSGGPGS